MLWIDSLAIGYSWFNLEYLNIEPRNSWSITFHIFSWNVLITKWIYICIYRTLPILMYAACSTVLFRGEKKSRRRGWAHGKMNRRRWSATCWIQQNGKPLDRSLHLSTEDR
jgi:hypothetical protein